MKRFLLLALLAASAAQASYHTIARVEVLVPAGQDPTYCVVSNGQGFSQYGWAQNGSQVCVVGYFTQPGTYRVTTYHNGVWTQPRALAEVLDGSGNEIQPAGNSFYLPASSYTVNVVLAE
jgi:hypothetical protein